MESLAMTNSRTNRLDFGCLNPRSRSLEVKRSKKLRITSFSIVAEISDKIYYVKPEWRRV